MLPVHERCVPIHKHCSRSHFEVVHDYRAERLRQLEAAEDASAGYHAEYEAYVQDHPLVTFKTWLQGMKR